jgi:Clr5 domain
MDNENVERLQEELRNAKKYADKWEILKPLIEHLFLDQRDTVQNIREVLKALFDFPA